MKKQFLGAYINFIPLFLVIFESANFYAHHYIYRPVVPRCAGCAMAHPNFGRSVNPISTRGDRLCPPNYYWHTRIFRPSDVPALFLSKENLNKYYIIFKIQH